MRAAIIDTPGKIRVGTISDPTPKPDELVIQVGACGICGTDLHIADGDSPLVRYPVVPGHELAGEVVAVGSNVPQTIGTGGNMKPTVGARVAIEPNLYCGYCEFCRTGHENLCLNYSAIGVTVNGGFAEYVTVPASKAYVLPENISFQEAALIEPVSCAVHGMHSLNPKSGDTFLIVGAGTMGLILLQLAVRGGASRVAVLDLGKFMVFGVASPEARMSLSPFRIYNDEITVLGSMAVLFSFGPALDLISGGVIDTKAVLTTALPLEDFSDALNMVRKGEGVKTQILPNG